MQMRDIGITKLQPLVLETFLEYRMINMQSASILNIYSIFLGYWFIFFLQQMPDAMEKIQEIKETVRTRGQATLSWKMVRINQKEVIIGSVKVVKWSKFLIS